MLNHWMLRVVIALVVTASLSALTFVGCASSQTADRPADRQLVFQARSTAIVALQSAETQTARYATAQAASDAAQAELSDIDAKAQRLFTIFERGAIRCGVHPNRPGYSTLDDATGYVGFFADLCRAVATATFGTPFAVEFVEIERGKEGEALIAGDIDILAASVDWTVEREADWGNGTLPVHFGGYSFLVPSRSLLDEPTDFNGETVCIVSGSLEEGVFLEWQMATSVAVDVLEFANWRHVISAYNLGFCSAIPGDQPTLAGLRREMEVPNDHKVMGSLFNEVRSMLAVPHGSDQWFDVVKFVVAGIVQAESLGVTSENAAESRSSQNIAVRRLAGYEGDFGQSDLNLDRSALQRVVSELGNYGEIHDRYFNTDTLRVTRGDNHLWSQGGLIYAPPLR